METCPAFTRFGLVEEDAQLVSPLRHTELASVDVGNSCTYLAMRPSHHYKESVGYVVGYCIVVVPGDTGVQSTGGTAGDEPVTEAPQGNLRKPP